MSAAVLARVLIDRVGPMFYLVRPKSLALNAHDISPRIIERAIPVMLAFIAIEAFYGRFIKDKSDPKKRHTKYNFFDTICSMSLGFVELVQELLLEIYWTKVASFAWGFVYNNFRLMTYDVKKHPLKTFFGAALGVDLGYYIFHRTMHEWQIGWMGHRVHHSGETYNMATALRQSFWQSGVIGPLFYCPLALVFNPNVIRAHKDLNLLYQYWVHTEAIGWLGHFERFFSTPSAHRMHHRTPGNCNYAGVLIIWDRIFGSYICENDTGYKDYYGLADPVKTFNVADINAGGLRRLGNMPGSWLHRITRRRHTGQPWVFQPMKLLEPLPAPKADIAEGRVKFEGPDVSVKSKLFAFAIFLAGLYRITKFTAGHKDFRKAKATIVIATLLAQFQLLSDYGNTGQKRKWLYATLAFCAGHVASMP